MAEKIEYLKRNLINNSKDNDLEEAYMLSELVDNSLSSWIEKNGEKPLGNGEKLIVEINYTSGKTIKENKIIVTDNAFGIKKQNMIGILTPGHKNNGTDFNQFGVGLKSAAFWAGRILTLKTKREENDFATEVVIDVNGDDQEPVEMNFIDNPYAPVDAIVYTSGNQYRTDHGTQVTFSDLYEKDRKFDKLAKNIQEIATEGINEKFMTKQEITIPVIAYKYKRYIEKGIMDVIFSFVDSQDEKKEKRWILNNEQIHYFEINKENVHRKLLSFIDVLNREDSKNKWTLDSAIDAIIGGMTDITEDMKALYRHLLKDDVDLTEDYKLVVGSESEMVTFGYLPFNTYENQNKAYWSKYSGLYLFQCDRAVCTGPNKSANGANYSHTYDIKGADRTRDNQFNWRRLYGMMDIDAFIKQGYLKLDHNKRGINESQSPEIEQFNRAISEKALEFAKKYQPIVDRVERWFERRDKEAQGISLDDTGQEEVMKTIGIESVGYYNISDGNIVTERPQIEEESAYYPKVYRLMIDNEPLLFTFHEYSGGRKDDYPYTYQEDFTKDGEELFKFEVNSDSELFLPLLKGTIDIKNKDEILKKVKEVFYKLAIVEITYDTYEKIISDAPDQEMWPEWVKTIKENYRDEKSIKDMLARNVCSYAK